MQSKIVGIISIVQLIPQGGVFCDFWQTFKPGIELTTNEVSPTMPA